MTLAPIDASSEFAVSDYLTKARDWLSTCVEMTGPEQIAAAKAEIATAAEATKQLGLSREIQDDAKEMVRRAEYALGKAIRKGQDDGAIRKAGQTQALYNRWTGEVSNADVPTARPTDLAGRVELYGRSGGDGILGLADDVPDPAHFDAAIDAAKAEGNLSRANVARKAREVSNLDAPKPTGPQRRALPAQFFDAAYDLTKVCERIDRLVADDRFPQNAETVGGKHRADLLRAVELLSKALDRFPN